MNAVPEHAVVSIGVTLAVAWLLNVVVRWVLDSRTLMKLPYAAAAGGNKQQQRLAYLTNSAEMYMSAYSKVKGSMCRMATSRDTEVIVLSHEFLAELKNVAEDVLSMSNAIADTMNAEYLNLDVDLPAIPHSIHAHLTPSLSRLIPTISAEVDKAMNEEIPACDDWTPVNIHRAVLQIVAAVTGRVFVGPPLCYDAAYREAAICYTVDLMAARADVQKMPAWQRPFRAPRLASVRQLQQRERDFVAVLEPVVARRVPPREKDEAKPDDMLQWILDEDLQRRDIVKTVPQLARILQGLTFAAIHTTSTVTTNAFYDMAAFPDVADELRAETEAVLATADGCFSSAVVQNMKRMDSCLRETARLHPMAFAAFGRKVMQPCVLSNGQRLPVGVTIEVSAYGGNRDADIFPEPDQYRPFRFCADEAGAGRTAGRIPQTFVSVSPANLTFGYGRRSCPGRFFATGEIKLILAKMLQKYEMRTEGAGGRYPNLQFAGGSFPNPTYNILLKKR